jgi:pyruvate/2-oxoglutarate dehydrogenase complex dihydrolipoamide dehydrogenase (E3) component
MHDAAALRERKDSVVASMRAMNLEQFRASGMELMMGSARFVAHRRVEVAIDERRRRPPCRGRRDIPDVCPIERVIRPTT